MSGVTCLLTFACLSQQSDLSPGERSVGSVSLLVHWYWSLWSTITGPAVTFLFIQRNPFRKTIMKVKQGVALGEGFANMEAQRKRFQEKKSGLKREQWWSLIRVIFHQGFCHTAYYGWISFSMFALAQRLKQSKRNICKLAPSIYSLWGSLQKELIIKRGGMYTQMTHIHVQNWKKKKKE